MTTKNTATTVAITVTPSAPAARTAVAYSTCIGMGLAIGAVAALVGLDDPTPLLMVICLAVGAVGTCAFEALYRLIDRAL